jgi:hypothetical protein
MSENLQDKVTEAFAKWQARQNRREHPTGKFDKAGRWNPSQAEWQSCCNAIRSPSRAYPYSHMTHCRSVEHVANLCGVSVAELRKLANANKRREGGDSYYKQVAVVDGKLLSIYDGETEYVVGQPMSERARQKHAGGFYVNPTIDAARHAVYPSDAKLRDAEKVVIRCQVSGQYCVYDNGKFSFSHLTPLEIVA